MDLIDKYLREGLIETDLTVTPSGLLWRKWGYLKPLDRKKAGYSYAKKELNLTPKQFDACLEVFSSLISWKSYKSPIRVFKIMEKNRKFISSLGNKYLQGGILYRGEFYKTRNKIDSLISGKSIKLKKMTAWTLVRRIAIDFSSNIYDTAGIAKKGWGIVFKRKFNDNEIIARIDSLKKNPIMVKIKKDFQTIKGRDQGEVLVKTDKIKFIHEDVYRIFSPSGVEYIIKDNKLIKVL